MARCLSPVVCAQRGWLVCTTGWVRGSASGSFTNHASYQEQLWDAYNLLNCRGDEGLAKIKRKYYIAAVRWHPDRAGGSTERFQRVRDAYELIISHRQGGGAQSSTQESARTSNTEQSRRRSPSGSHWRRTQRSWGTHEEDDEEHGPEPKTELGRWLWKVALAFITARVALLVGIKVAIGDSPDTGAPPVPMSGLSGAGAGATTARLSLQHDDGHGASGADDGVAAAAVRVAERARESHNEHHEVNGELR